ncbi:MAG TPA: T9SS type A sorting domain-containing protein, partial [Bacteroidia bacterium]|nr:T9SS type A sorting domain-containing protein [Bacteroidia bacterium]
PIRTNTVLNTIGWPAVPISIDLPSTGAKVVVWPNPAENEAFVQVQGLLMDQKLEIGLYSMIGQKVYAGSFDNSEVHRLDLSKLAGGTYVYRITGAGAMLKTGKIILK